MAVTLNASTSAGLVQSADLSGIITLQNNGTNAVTITSGNLQFNSGYGSVATAYGCRAWVNFDGTTNTGGFCTIRASGNVTSVADNGTGDYTVNFSTAMPDANYAASGFCVDTAGSGANGSIVCGARGTTPTALAFRFTTKFNQDAGLADVNIITIEIFR